MTEHPPRRTLRSVGALLAGFFAGVVLSLGTDQILHVTGVYPPWGQPMSDGVFLLATAYRAVYGVVGLVVSLAGLAATWNKGPEFGPKWYPIALVLLALPSVWAGGMLHAALARGRGGRC